MKHWQLNPFIEAIFFVDSLTPMIFEREFIIERDLLIIEI